MPKKTGYVIENLKGGNYLCRRDGSGICFWSPDLAKALIYKTWQDAERGASTIGLTSNGDCAMFEVEIGKRKTLRVISNPMALRNPYNCPVVELKRYLQSRIQTDKKKLWDWFEGDPMALEQLIHCVAKE